MCMYVMFVSTNHHTYLRRRQDLEGQRHEPAAKEVHAHALGPLEDAAAAADDEGLVVLVLVRERAAAAAAGPEVAQVQGVWLYVSWEVV